MLFYEMIRICRPLWALHEKLIMKQGKIIVSFIK